MSMDVDDWKDIGKFLFGFTMAIVAMSGLIGWAWVLAAWVLHAFEYLLP